MNFEELLASITANWGGTDEASMQVVADLRDFFIEYQNTKDKEIEELKKTNEELLKQNVDVNRTNQTLFLRLTDPKFQVQDEEEDLEDDFDINDFNSFVKNE